MDKSAIIHIPMSEYAYGVDENHVTIRLRCKKDDLKSVYLIYGDRSCRNTPVDFTKIKMEVVASTKWQDYFEVTLENPHKRLNYCFLLNDGKEEIYYYGDMFEKEIVDDRSEYFQLPFNHRADIVSPPEWTKDAIVYNIFPDSFATSKRFISNKETSKTYKDQIVKGKRGGTIRGIIENIDYLKDLGINTIYTNPIFTAGEYHKYDLLDYFSIDPCFGTNEDFEELVNVCHKNQIRIIIDGVFNHCGWKFFAFEDVVINQEKSKYKDWFYGLKFPVVRPDDPEEYPTYDCFGYERMMPKLALDNEETANYFCSVGKYWIEKYDIDGWRLDVASEINDGFWRKFNETVKSAKPEAILIGEVWESANHWLDGTIFDSAMNYDFRKHCKRFFAEESEDSLDFDTRVTNMRLRYRKQTVFSELNVLDTHDVSRFLSVCNGKIENYKLALVFQMTFMGMPTLFYGDEKGLTGVLEDEYRQPMAWDKESDLLLFIKKLISLRKEEVTLRRGDFKTIYAKEKSRLYGYERYIKDERTAVYINMSDAEEVIADINKNEILLTEGFNENKNSLSGKGFCILKMRRAK